MRRYSMLWGVEKESFLGIFYFLRISHQSGALRTKLIVLWKDKSSIGGLGDKSKAEAGG
ncbi:hypothetical protein [Neobacillus niacini]|uniref:hypothetical protein n=1 Tax=Neobacillus niacini TaxID=86668 RepID=UPI001C3F3744|nr:hypothetical protein [Neobacillus niacini]